MRLPWICRLFLLMLCAFTSVHAQSAAERGSTLRGTVRDESGISVAGATVRLEGSMRQSITDASGRFVIAGLAAGRYLVAVASGVRRAAAREVSLDAGASVDLTITLVPRVQRLAAVRVEDDHDAYAPTSTSFGLKAASSVYDVPFTVQTVSRAQIDDRAAIDIRETIRGVSGINVGRSATTELVIRGFNDNGSTSSFGARGSIYQINGLRNYLTDYTSDVQLVNVDRIEVLKGASGVLYGFNQPGGVINLVTKKPQAERATTVTLAGGTWDRYRILADATGPLSEDGRLLYRFNAGLVSSGDQREVAFNRNITLAPSLTYQLDDRTRVDAEFLYTRTNRLAWFDWGLPTRDAAGNDIFRRVSLQYSPHQQGDETRLTTAGAIVTLRRDLGASVSWTSGLTVSGNRTDTQGHYPEFGLPAATGDVNLVYRNANSEKAGLFASNYLTSAFRTGVVQHRLVTGFDVFSGRGQVVEISAENTPALPNNVPATNFRNPAAASVDANGVPRLTRNYVFNGGYNGYERSSFVGAYVQDQISLSSWITALVGLRIDQFRTTQGLDAPAIRNRPFNPNVGLVIRPQASLSLYGSYTQGFEPQLNQDPDAGGPFDPLYSRQLEAGVKKGWRGGRLFSSASVFRLQRVNQLVSANDSARPERLVQTGEARSEGVEVDIAGAITNDWRIVANYANTFARIFSAANPSIVGRQLANAPRQMGAVWTTYTLARGPLAGTMLGAGINAVGTRLGSSQFRSYGGYTTVDATVRTRIAGATLAVNAYNLGNVRYVSGIWSDFYAQRGAPRNLLITLTVPSGPK